MALVDDLAKYAIENDILEEDWCNAIAQMYAIQALMSLESGESDSYVSEVRLGPDVIETTSIRRRMQ